MRSGWLVGFISMTPDRTEHTWFLFSLIQREDALLSPSRFRRGTPGRAGLARPPPRRHWGHGSPASAASTLSTTGGASVVALGMLAEALDRRAGDGRWRQGGEVDPYGRRVWRSPKSRLPRLRENRCTGPAPGGRWLMSQREATGLVPRCGLRTRWR